MAQGGGGGEATEALDKLQTWLRAGVDYLPGHLKETARTLVAALNTAMELGEDGLIYIVEASEQLDAMIWGLRSLGWRGSGVPEGAEVPDAIELVRCMGPAALLEALEKLIDYTAAGQGGVVASAEASQCLGLGASGVAAVDVAALLIASINKLLNSLASNLTGPMRNDGQPAREDGEPL